MKKNFIKTPLIGVQVHGAKDVGTRTVNLLMGEHAGEYVRGDIMDANAVIQAFDELRGNVNNDHDSLEEIVDELHNLRDATDQSFEVFQEKAEEETANRIQGDKALGDRIDAEKQERINADTELRNDLNGEISRATAKEEEIKAVVDTINGDSTTNGSFRKAIADVVGAAPEAYDTLKEIADKLKSNDDLHTAINDAIAEKATTAALDEEITRAKAAESGIKNELADKADATALSKYVLTTALNKQVDTLNAAISAKQDAGNYITFEERGLNDDTCYIIAPRYYIECRTDKFDNGKYNYSHMSSQLISVHNSGGGSTSIEDSGIVISDGGDFSNSYHLQLTNSYISSRSNGSSNSLKFELNGNGLKLEGGRDNKVLTSNGSTIDITQYAKKSELPAVPTKVSQLTNDSEFITKSVYDEKIAALEARIAALEAKHSEAVA